MHLGDILQDDIFTFTDVFRDLFEEALALRFKDPENYPPVGVVAFASPRIGDINFVKAFNTRSLVDPWPLQQVWLWFTEV